MRRLALALLLFAIGLPARVAAAVLVGEVVAVTDGDTIRVLDAEKRQHKVRIAAIATPERRQAFSRQARDVLADLVFRRMVEVHWEKRDRYGRIVGKVLAADPVCEAGCARTLDVGLALVRSGHAWWYRRYAGEQTPEDRARYEAAERRAREAKIGLWSDPAPTPPWEWRRSRRRR